MLGVEISRENGVRFAPGRFTRDLRRSVAGFFAATAKNLVDDVLEWALGYAVRYLVAAGAILAAVVFLFAALKEGIVALGAAPWIVSLGLAVVAGLVGFLLIRTGPRTVTSRERKALHHGGGVDVRIVRRRRNRRPRARTRTRTRVRVRVRRAVHHNGASRRY